MYIYIHTCTQRNIYIYTHTGNIENNANNTNNKNNHYNNENSDDIYICNI